MKDQIAQILKEHQGLADKETVEALAVLFEDAYKKGFIDGALSSERNKK